MIEINLPADQDPSPYTHPSTTRPRGVVDKMYRSRFNHIHWRGVLSASLGGSRTLGQAGEGAKRYQAALIIHPLAILHSQKIAKQIHASRALPAVNANAFTCRLVGTA